MQARRTTARLATVSLIAVAWVVTPRPASAHCDTLDGPVVATARAALDKDDVTPVLAWVKKENEGEIRAAFAKSLKHAGESVEAGRAFVAAYVNYVHYVERLHKDAVGSAGHAEEGAGAPGGPEHE